MEIGVPSHRVEYFDEAENTSLVASNLDLVVEKKARTELRTAIYQHRISGLYEKKVRHRSFKKGDLILRRVTQNTRVLLGQIGKDLTASTNPLGQVHTSYST